MVHELFWYDLEHEQRVVRCRLTSDCGCVWYVVISFNYISVSVDGGIVNHRRPNYSYIMLHIYCGNVAV